MKARMQVLAYFALFAPVFAVSVLHGWLIILESGTLMRPRLSWWRQLWGGVFLKLFSWVVNLRITYVMPSEEDIGYLTSGPCIVVSNHANVLDAFLIPYVEGKLRLGEVRWLMKEPLKRAFGFGAMFRYSGAVFLQREKGSEDILNIQATAAHARSQGFSMGILPEGTRGAGALLPPKSGGLKVIVRNIPDVPIVSISIVGGPPLGSGKTMWDGVAFCGQRMHVIVRVHHPIKEEQVEAWLEDEWERKHAELAAGPP